MARLPEPDPALPPASPQAPLPLYERLRMALLEDHGPGASGGQGDVTSQALVPETRIAKGIVMAKAEGVLCGVHLLSLIFQMADELVSPEAQARAAKLEASGEAQRTGTASVEQLQAAAGAAQQAGFQVQLLKKDGARVQPGEGVAELCGNARALLFGERTALNLIGRLSGIATQTARYAACCEGTKAKVLDTRKTTPLWRDLEKYAVKTGGGENHRRGLYDMVLIKDNHLALWGTRQAAEAVRVARARYPKLALEVEVTDLAGLARVCRGSRPDYVLLDNFTVEQVAEASRWCDEYYARRSGRPLLEASGGITLETIRAYAQAGADRISAGALTHSAPALDFSLAVKVF